MKYKVGVISLGCDKNLIDTEYMLALLSNNKFILTDDRENSHIILVNTCGFIESAKQESIDAIKQMAEHKITGKCKLLVVTGCLAQRHKEELIEEIPEIDAIVGTGSYHEIVDVINKALDGERVFRFGDINSPYDIDDRIMTTPSYTSFLKIAEGCSNYCTYCIIPKLRGNYRSRPIESIMNEAQMLSKNGVKEIIIIAQDTTKYGLDLYGELKLSYLLNQLCKLDFTWIRLLYCYPEGITDELISTIKSQPKICNYLDMPIQHSNNKVLKLMGRKSTKENLLMTINKLRNEIPDIAIRTTIIVGFPGEGDEEYKDLLGFIKKSKLNRVGVFAYSKEEGTSAANFESQVSQKTKENRLEKLMMVQQNISLSNNKKTIGKTLQVLVEDVSEGNVYIGRSYMDCPEIDGQIYFRYDKILDIGDFVNIRITDVDEYDMNGEIINEFSK